MSQGCRLSVRTLVDFETDFEGCQMVGQDFARRGFDELSFDVGQVVLDGASEVEPAFLHQDHGGPRIFFAGTAICRVAGLGVFARESERDGCRKC
jgi:hypothetical protein